MAAGPFVPFGAQHGVAVAIVLIAATALVVVMRRATTGRPPGSARLDRAIRWGLAIGCVGIEVSELVRRMVFSGASLRSTLPLNLCDASILIGPVVLLTAHRRLYELLYFWGIGGALQALATPIVTRGFPDPRCLGFFLGHGLVLSSALYATVVLRLRPVPRSILRVWLITTAYGLAMVPVNHWLGTNYLFVLRKPDTPSLLDLMGPWPWYLATLSGVAFLVLLICYLPFSLKDQAGRRGQLGSPSAFR